MKLAICGPGRSGKDAAAEWLAAHTRLRYRMSTSEVIIPHAAKKLGLSDRETFDRRHEFRQVMLETGRELRATDPAALVRVVLSGGDIAVGVRDRIEMEAAIDERLVDLAVWIDRPGVAPDPTLGYGPELCHLILPNHWGLAAMFARLRSLSLAMGVLKT